MNMKLVKRFIAVTMAATLMVAPVITASAATEDSQPETPAVVTEDVKTEAVANVGGVVIKSDVPIVLVGTSKADTAISNVVPRQSTAQIKANTGLASNETPTLLGYGITEQKAPAAFSSANAVATFVKGQIDGAVNLKFAKKSGKTVTDLPADVTVPMTFALKRTAPAGFKAVVLKIVSGGEFTILEDQGNTPGSITVPVSGGNAAYFIMYVPIA